MIMTVKAASDPVIDPVAFDLNASMARMKRMPETCPMRRRTVLDAPSGIGRVISAAY